MRRTCLRRFSCATSARVRLPEDRPIDLLALLDQFPAVVWATDRELRIVYSRGAALKNLGLGRDDLVGLAIADYVGSADPASPAIVAHRAALDGTSTSGEYAWHGRTFHAHVEPLWQGSTITGAVGVALDVTDRIHAEATLRRELHARVVESIARLAVAVAHEINNPLMVIVTQLETLAGSVRPEELPRIEACRLAIERMTGVVHSLSRLTRLEAATGWPPELPAMLDLRRSARPVD